MGRHSFQVFQRRRILPSTIYGPYPEKNDKLELWNREDRSRPWDVMTHYHKLQLADFLDAVSEDREPLVGPEDGRRVVELFTAVYRSQHEHASQRLPLAQ